METAERWLKSKTCHICDIKTHRGTSNLSAWRKTFNWNLWSLCILEMRCRWLNKPQAARRPRTTNSSTSEFECSVPPMWPMMGRTYSTHTLPIFPIGLQEHMLSCSLLQGCWEIYVETYAGVVVAEALIRLRNLVLDPPSNPSSHSHTHTRSPSLCARRCLSCKPLEMCAWNSSWSGEINCYRSVINGVNLWLGPDHSSRRLARTNCW